jgi:purine-cytosine permease-like protein
MPSASLFQLLYFDLTFLYDIVSVIISNMIGGIVMSQSNLEKQEAKLKQLNQKIKKKNIRLNNG